MDATFQPLSKPIVEAQTKKKRSTTTKGTATSNKNSQKRNAPKYQCCYSGISTKKIQTKPYPQY